MNRQDLEDRLRADALRMRAEAPAGLRRRVAARIRSQERPGFARPLRWPALAGALGAVVAALLVWTIDRPGERELPGMQAGGLNDVAIVASSDRLLAYREAALAEEWRLLEQDLQSLRDQVTNTFEIKHRQ